MGNAVLIAWGKNRTAELQTHDHGSFKGFCQAIHASCKPGIKGKAIYFIRGGELKDHWRNDDNLISAELLVADIDITNVQPSSAHKLLKSKKLTHFIYTTSSYTEEKPKYRIVLPFKTKNREDCARATAYLNFTLTGDIELAGESYVWSQEWFVSVADETGTWFYEGDQLSIPDDFTVSKANTKDAPNTAAVGETTTYDQHLIEMIKTGDAHNHYGPMCLALANTGKDAKYIFKRIQPLVKQSFEMNNREYDETRDDNIWQTAISAVAKVGKEYAEKNEDGVAYMPKFEPNKIAHSKDYPPGLMGELVAQAEKMSHYPNKHISMAWAITFVAGIVGRTYNVNGSGLNIYTTVLADTGMGKDILSKVTVRVLLESTPTGNIGRSFIGSSRYTGPKPVWQDMQEGMSKICVMTEAGIMNGSRVGDKENLERVLLNMYTSSGKGSFLNNERYSSKDDSLPMLHSPALSLLQESTPGVFVRNMIGNSGDIKGELARMWVVRITDDKPHINRDIRQDFSTEIKDRIRALIIKCKDNQSPDVLKIVKNFKPTEHMFEVANRFIDDGNKALRYHDLLKVAVLSRAFMKALKLASIIDVFNGDELQDSTFDWVCRHIIDVEAKNIGIIIRDEDGSDIIEIIKNIIAPYISKMLNGEYKGPRMPPKILGKNMFTKSNLRQCVQQHRVIKQLNARSGGSTAKHGFDIVLDYMLAQEFIVRVNSEELSQKVITKPPKDVFLVTRRFLELIE